MKKVDFYKLHADISRAGFTIQQVCSASEVSVHVNTFTNWKKGNTPPDPKRVKAFVAAFKKLKQSIKLEKTNDKIRGHNDGSTVALQDEG